MGFGGNTKRSWQAHRPLRPRPALPLPPREQCAPCIMYETCATEPFISTLVSSPNQYPRPSTRVAHAWAHASSQCEVSSHAGCGHTGGTHAMPRAHVDIPADRLCRLRAEAGEAPRRPPRPPRQPLTRTCSTRISRSTRARSRLKAQSACSQRPTSCEPLPRDPSASRHVYLFPSQDLPRM